MIFPCIFSCIFYFLSLMCVCVCVGSIWGQQGVLVIAAPKRKRLAFDGEEQQDVQEGGGEGGEELKDEEDEEGDPAEPGCRPEVQLTTG